MAASGDRTLAIKYTADPSANVKAAKDIEDAHAALGSKVDSVGSGIAGTLVKMASGFEGLASKAGFNTGSIGSAISGLSGKFEAAAKAPKVLSDAQEAGAESGISSSAALAAGVVAGVVVAGGAIAKFAMDGVKDYVSLADQVRSFSEVSGASAEESSKLIGISNDLGVSSDSLSRGMFNLGKNIEANPAKLEALGVSIARAKNGSVDLVGTLENVAEASQKAGQGSQADEIATTAFGKAGLELLPILSQTKQALDAMASTAPVLSEQDVQNALQYQISLQQLHDTTHSVAVTLGAELAPALTKVDHVLTEGILYFTKGAAAAGVYAAGLSSGAEKAKAAAEVQQQATAQQQKAIDTLQASVTSTANAQDALATATRGVTTAEQSAATAAHGVTTAEQAAASASEAVTKARRTEADDQAKLNTLLAAGTINTNAIASATKNLESADRTLETSQVSLGKAIEDVAAKQQAEVDAQNALNAVMAGPSATDVAKAQEAVGRATNDVTQRRLAQQVATDNLAKVMADSTATDAQKQQAQVDLSNANYDLTDATDAQATAQANLTSLENEAVPGSQQLTAAQQALHKAQEDLSDSTMNAAQAEQNLTDAQQGDLEARNALTTAMQPDQALIDGIAQAKQKLADDSDAVTQAVQAEANATYAVGQAQQSAANAYDAVATAKAGAAKAAFDLATATDKETTLLQGEQDIAQLLANELGTIATNTPASAPIVAQLLQLLGFVPQNSVDANGVLHNAAGNVVAGPTALPKRAGGGPTTAGTTYLVGEEGPEIFTSPTDGFITPNDALNFGGAATPVTGAAAPIMVTTTINLDGQQVARVVTNHQASSGRRNGSIFGSLVPANS